MKVHVSGLSEEIGFITVSYRQTARWHPVCGEGEVPRSPALAQLQTFQLCREPASHKSIFSLSQAICNRLKASPSACQAFRGLKTLISHFLCSRKASSRLLGQFRPEWLKQRGYWRAGNVPGRSCSPSLSLVLIWTTEHNPVKGILVLKGNGYFYSWPTFKLNFKVFTVSCYHLNLRTHKIDKD